VAPGRRRADADGTGGNAKQHCRSRAQQNQGSRAGYGTLLALLALGFVLAYWQLFLAVGLVVLSIIGLATVVLRQNQQQLRALVTTADRPVRNDLCQVRGQFGAREVATSPMFRKLLPLALGGLTMAAALTASAGVVCATGFVLNSYGQCVRTPVVVRPVVTPGPAVYGGAAAYHGPNGAAAVRGPAGNAAVQGPAGGTVVHTENHGNVYRH